MNTDDERDRSRPDQAAMRFDDAPDRFKAGNKSDQFSGASGVLFEQAMAQTRMAITLCDPNQPDLPIVFANRAFRRLTGYSEEEILGRNCRFLQGPKTDPEPVARIREAIAKEDVVVVEMLNYRKNGTTFWNALHLGPIYNDEGELVYFFGSQWDVSDVRAARAEERHAKEMARELSHRMKNMFAVISGIVNVTGRVRGVQGEAAEINSRIQALGRAYETTLDDASSGSIDIGEAIKAVLAPYEGGSGRLETIGGAVRMPFSTVSVIGLILHEFAANATKHGAWSVDAGAIKVDWRASDDGETLIINWAETGGPKLDKAAIASGTGTAIVDRLLSAGNGSIERDWRDDGLVATIKVPTRSV
ncbi:MAG: PAS domain-containing protein [Pseudomonadota bacterium]